MRAVEGNLGHSPLDRYEEDWKALARDKARLGALRAERVKTLRAVGDSSEPSQGLETRASLEGSFWSLAAVALDTISTSNDSIGNFESTWIKGLSGIGR